MANTGHSRLSHGHALPSYCYGHTPWTHAQEMRSLIASSRPAAGCRRRKLEPTGIRSSDAAFWTISAMFCRSATDDYIWLWQCFFGVKKRQILMTTKNSQQHTVKPMFGMVLGPCFQPRPHTSGWRFRPINIRHLFISVAKLTGKNPFKQSSDNNCNTLWPTLLVIVDYLASLNITSGCWPRPRQIVISSLSLNIIDYKY